MKKLIEDKDIFGKSKFFTVAFGNDANTEVLSKMAE